MGQGAFTRTHFQPRCPAHSDGAHPGWDSLGSVDRTQGRPGDLGANQSQPNRSGESESESDCKHHGDPISDHAANRSRQGWETRLCGHSHLQPKLSQWTDKQGGEGGKRKRRRGVRCESEGAHSAGSRILRYIVHQVHALPGHGLGGSGGRQIQQHCGAAPLARG